MILQVRIQLTERQLRELAWRNHNFKREEPEKSWKLNEYKEAARDQIIKIIINYVTEEISKRY